MSSRVIRMLADAVTKGDGSRNGLEFARFINRIAPDEPDDILLLAYLSHAVMEESHTCLPLDGKELSDAISRYSGGVVAEIDHGQIAGSSVVGKPGDRTPLVVDNGLLYLHRYHYYERFVAGQIMERACRVHAANDAQAAADMVRRMFPPGPASPDWQKIAVFNALFSGLLVISGGPGTGKTRTVTAIMAMFLTMSGRQDPVIAMCAPTGKAAARLSRSVASASAALDLPDRITERLPSSALTLHRLLGAGRRRGAFRYNSGNPLPCDMLVVDEVSMVDLPLMAHLMEALQEDTVLVMLGDRDQLASVEAGSVMGDVCMGCEILGFSDEFVTRCKMTGEDIEGRGTTHVKVSGRYSEGDKRLQRLRDSVITLEYSYRFQERSGIVEFAGAVNRGDVDEALRLLSDTSFPGISLVRSNDRPLASLLAEEFGQELMAVHRASSIKEALVLVEQSRILCGLKKGAFGAEYANSVMEAVSAATGRRLEAAGIPAGAPVIITRNDYALGLFNGDTGVAWPDDTGSLRIWFDMGGDAPTGFSPSRLPSFELAWAITVHRSQGSEFDRVLFVLPPAESAMTGRELLYTAVTRARQEIILWGNEDDVRACITTGTRRYSGLGRMLWGSAHG